MTTRYPRLVIAGTGGDSGKTFLSLGLLAAFRGQKQPISAFKKGPDYIDAAWLRWAAGVPCYNLDLYLQPKERILASFARHAAGTLAVVEGNRGLFDGMDLAGSQSTANLARLLGAPVVLVVSAAKVTRTVAAVVLGCKALEPELPLAGVVLNRVAGPRHEAMVRRAVEELAGVPVLGALPRLKQNPLPDRHLGLVTPEEHGETAGVAQQLAELISERLDLPRLQRLAAGAAPLPCVEQEPFVAGPDLDEPATLRGPRVRVGYFCDSAFTFYYPDNLEALQQAGAELVPISGLSDAELPAVDALYLGGGFPETHAAELSKNDRMRASVKAAAEAGMPIYAECGGMIYLCRELVCGEQRHAMAGVLPLELSLFARPQGHGYVELEADGENPFFPGGTVLRGHEFHYTRVTAGAEGVRCAFAVRRGTGTTAGRDGVVYKNVLAGYTHLHALGTPRWASALVERAARFRGSDNLGFG